MFPFGSRVNPAKRTKWALSTAQIKSLGAKSIPDLAAEAVADIMGVGVRSIWNWRAKRLDDDAVPLLEFFGMDVQTPLVIAALADVLPTLPGLDAKTLKRRAIRRAIPVLEDAE